MTVAAVIFDVDGTLVDSNGLHALAWECAFTSLGLSVPYGQILPLIGKAGDKLVKDLVSVDPATAKRLGEQEPQEFERMARRDGISPYSGSEELLRELKKRGSRTAIATSSGRSGFQVVLETTDLPSLRTMDVVVTGDDVKDAKPAPDLVRYLGEDGQPATIDSADVNDYIREATGEHFTAKDFRTWAGTVSCALALRQALAKTRTGPTNRQLVKAIEQVATQLRNTPAVCRKSYIHPGVIASYLAGTLPSMFAAHVRSRRSHRLRGLRAGEAAVLALLGR